MAAKRKINLLPKELSAGSDTVQYLKKINTATMFFGALFLLIAIIGGVLLYFLSQRRSDLQNTQIELTRNIETLEQSEQGLVITRDRLAKIGQILGERESERRFVLQENVVSQMPVGLRVDEAEVGSNGSTLSLAGPDSSLISEVVDLINFDDRVAGFVIEAIDFNAFIGFNIEMDIF